MRLVFIAFLWSVIAISMFACSTTPSIPISTVVPTITNQAAVQKAVRARHGAA